ncbi:MAG: hypothetical protein QM820_63140 [Minicystis sp.]
MAGEKDKEDKDAGKETAEALKSLIARVGEIFGVFDLSFFVAGAVCFGALAFGAYVYYGSGKFEGIQIDKWSGLQVGAVVLSCYVLGLVCFAVGRRVRRKIHSEDDFYVRLPDELDRFDLRAHYARFLPKDPDEKASDKAKADHRDLVVEHSKLLYTRLWAEARQNKQLASSFALLVRYWVMAAMCDGLAVAFALWFLVWIYWVWLAEQPDLTRPGSPFIQCAGAGILLSAAWFCLGEAKRYGDYQMSELLATLAQARAAREASPGDRRSDAKPSAQDVPMELAGPFDKKWPYA